MARTASLAAEQPTPSSPRVLIVDDSAVARAMLTQLVEASARYVVAGAVSNAGAALSFLRSHPVDLVLLDIAMPGTDGLTALPDLVAAGRGARIVIVSSAAADGAAATVRALALGAADTLVKPDAIGESSSRFRTELLVRLDRLSIPESAPASPVVTPYPARNQSEAASPGVSEPFALLALGASTGGIHALGRLLGALPASFRAPILITQHLPGSFMPYFAAQLAVLAGRPAEVASDRLRLHVGRIVVAPGDAHLRCIKLPEGGAAIRLDREPQPSGCSPSVDPMLASVAEVFGERAVAAVLSGMGRDGADGARRLADAGGCLLAQDRSSSVVWGMPGAVASFAQAVLPPEGLAARIAAGRRV